MEENVTDSVPDKRAPVTTGRARHSPRNTTHAIAPRRIIAKLTRKAAHMHTSSHAYTQRNTHRLTRTDLTHL